MVLNTGIAWIDAVGTPLLWIGIMWLIAELVTRRNGASK